MSSQLNHNPLFKGFFMEAQSIHVRRAAVLGAGVMGAQIAAHLANAGIPVLLYELAAQTGNPNAPAELAVQKLSKLSPSPLASDTVLRAIRPVNYEHHLALLAECDLVLEAVAERPDIKKSLYERI